MHAFIPSIQKQTGESLEFKIIFVYLWVSVLHGEALSAQNPILDRIVVYAYNPSTVEDEDGKSKTVQDQHLGYIHYETQS